MKVLLRPACCCAGIAALCFLTACGRNWLTDSVALKDGSTFFVKVLPAMHGEGLEPKVTQDEMNRVVEALKHRLNPDGTTALRVEAVEGDDHVQVRLPHLDANGIQHVCEVIQKRTRLEFRLVHPESGHVESKVGYEQLPTQREADSTTDIKKLLVRNHADLDGRHIAQAFATKDPHKGWLIILRFDAEGAAQFAQLTGEHRGERLAVVLDGTIVSAPMVREAITGGSVEISGRFDEFAAHTLAAALGSQVENPLIVLDPSAPPPGPR